MVPKGNPAIMFQVILVLLSSLIAINYAAPPPGNNGQVLVLVDDLETKATHSQFISSLKDKGYSTTILTASDTKASLSKDGEYVYDNLLLLCPHASKISGISSGGLTRFLESGRNVFITADTQYSTFTKTVTRSIGVDIDRAGWKVIDHQNVVKDLDNGDHSYTYAGGISDSKYMFGGDVKEKKVVFSGIGAGLFDDNELIDSVIWGSSSSYSYIPGEKVVRAPLATGFDVVLGAGLSTRVGSRAGYWGSIEVLSNEVFGKVGKSHQDVLMRFLGWTFGYAGVLRWGNVQYDRVGHVGKVMEGYQEEEGGYFRVKDILGFSIDIEVWDGEGSGQWKRYTGSDVQLEFTMMDPYVRKRLAVNKGGNGTHSTTVTVPDKIGVYKFVIEYWRVGVSPILFKEEVPIRPFMHNEYERFIGQAIPYYTSAFSMLAGVFLLGLAVLYSGSVYGEGKGGSPSSKTDKVRAR